jgi:hypothetical protein
MSLYYRCIRRFWRINLLRFAPVLGNGISGAYFCIPWYTSANIAFKTMAIFKQDPKAADIASKVAATFRQDPKTGKISYEGRAEMAAAPIPVRFSVDADAVLRAMGDRSAYIRAAVLEKMQADGLLPPP